ncbi:helix-turn-helix domain-containing protein [Pseudobacteriovorax antillogorgiicola]|uniref:Helix-turn-helix n=1 Tax=Pseudobacteriovorax antillogorgiicola TaxID=1513793 RepID=A0A1Y6CTN4_9BACT|nr:helix-turn-helix transcriptional regulator [Pseudobacteriovorax antillogorgiicola]TCS44632.1 helix-turn-helix protein [Pseudobacteriovorax antillogorgiicola]SMF78483.1 Helix-turn-helix [Pseudobacteriovorax antillogorgiicola]
MSQVLENPKINANYNRLIDDLELARKKRNWSQGEIAKRAKISIRAYKKLIAKKSLPSLETFLKVLIALGMTEEFFDLANPAKDSFGLSLDRIRHGKKQKASDDNLDF